MTTRNNNKKFIFYRFYVMIDFLILLLQKSKSLTINMILGGSLYLLGLLCAFGLGYHRIIYVPFEELTLWGIIAIIGAFIGLFFVVYFLLKTWKQKETRYEYLYSVILPLLLVLEVLVGEYFNVKSFFVINGSLSSRIGWFLGGLDAQRLPGLALALTGVYPLGKLFQKLYRPTEGYTPSGLLSLALNYNIAYYTVFFCCSLIQVFGDGNLRALLSSLQNTNLLTYIIGLLIYGCIISFPFIARRVFYKDSGYRFTSVARGSISLIIVLFFTIIVPDRLVGYFDNLRERGSSILSQGGLNYESFTKAKKIGLEQAYLNYFKKNNYMNDENFNKLFDATPETYFGDKLNIDNDGRNRAGTNATQVNDNAQIVLKLAEITNIVDSDKSFVKTVYSFHVQNITSINQEFIVYFQTPSVYSVITKLTLGLNGEMEGIVASRGAARRVYEDALITRRDPALIEKVGASSYSLRVFPVLSKLDQTTQGRQLVQVTILTPLLYNDAIARSPKFSFVNLKLNEESSVLYKQYNNELLIENEKYKNDEATKFLSDFSYTSTTGNKNFCVSKSGLKLLIDNNNPPTMNGSEGIPSPTIKLNLSGLGKTDTHINRNKIALFFDNSLSVKRNASDTFYKAIYASLGKSGDIFRDIDLYTYNFTVEKLADLQEIKYRGYSDTEGVLDFIEKNTITNQNIIFITDDDSFSLSTYEKKTRDLSKIATNRIQIISLGDNIKRYTPDFMNIISMNGGNIYTISHPDQITGIISSLLNAEYITPPVFCTGNTNSSLEHEQISAGILSSWLLTMIRNQTGRGNVAQFQHKLATHYQIVNQFNAMIALETKQQKDDLTRYEQYEDRFDSKLELGGTNNGSTATKAPEQEPMPIDDSLQIQEDSTNNGGFDQPTDSSNTFTVRNNNSSVGYGTPRSSLTDYDNGEFNDYFKSTIAIGLFSLIEIYQLILCLLVIWTKRSNNERDSNESIT